MCGIVGIVAHQAVNQDLFDGLIALQHRGQDAAGIATCEDKNLYLQKNNGMVREVFRTRHMHQLKGNMGIGHVRYPTAGSKKSSEAQPFYVNSPYGIMLAHNGNLTNTKKLHKELMSSDHRHLNTDSDSEVILNVFAHALGQVQHTTISPDDIFQAVSAVHRRCEGAYAVVAMIAGIGLVAFRDPNAIRPVIYGHRDSESGQETMIASESVALDMNGFSKMGDLQAGEALFVEQNGAIHKKQCADKTAYHPCLFEYVYLARPDSIIDNILVYKVRLKAGQHLAEKIQREFSDNDIDVVMPIPDTSRPAAALLARKLGLKFREGFVKNRYIGRTFIMPGQKLRCRSVRQKLNAIPLEFKDKNVLLVDDSIVRGTTAKEIIQMARDAGANKVYFASAAPEIRHPNVYGIDMPAASELIAHNRTVDEIKQLIGADRLIFQDLDDLITSVREGNSDITRFEDCVFTGDYLTGDIDQAYLDYLAHKRAERHNSLWKDNNK